MEAVLGMTAVREAGSRRCEMMRKLMMAVDSHVTSLGRE